MKSISTFFILLSIIAWTSCDFKPPSSIGFSSDFTETSEGLTIKDVNSKGDYLRLEGTIKLDKGAVNVRLTNPKGEDVYDATYTAPAHVVIIERYERMPGYWKLRYESLEGRGNIDLHMN